MKQTCWLLLAILQCLCLAGPRAISAPIFIDSRLLIMAHPLFKAFNLETGRFDGTCSEPIKGGYQGLLAAENEVRQLQDKCLNSSKTLHAKMKNVPLNERIDFERNFLIEKHNLQKKLEAYKMRVYFAGHVPMKIGMTSIASIMPQTNDIARAIKKTIKKLKQAHKTKVVIDIANLLPIPKQNCATPNLALNKQQNITKYEIDELKAWLKEANSYWAERFGFDSDIIITGAEDARLEALKLIEEDTKGYRLFKW